MLFSSLDGGPRTRSDFNESKIAFRSRFPSFSILLSSRQRIFIIFSSSSVNAVIRDDLTNLLMTTAGVYVEEWDDLYAQRSNLIRKLVRRLFSIEMLFFN